MIPILSETETRDLIRWQNSHRHLESIGSAHDYKGIRKLHIQNETIRLLFQKVENHCIAEIYKATGKVFYPEMSSITKWHIGGEQTPHLDTYSNQETHNATQEELEQMEKFPSREWTVIVYLNDDFRGGETYFPPSDHYPFGHQVEPKAGHGLLFQGIHHSHGVFKVRRKHRHTIAIWFTEDQGKAHPTVATSDLNLNENSIKPTLQYHIHDLLLKNDNLHYDSDKWLEWKRRTKSVR